MFQYIFEYFNSKYFQMYSMMHRKLRLGAVMKYLVMSTVGTLMTKKVDMVKDAFATQLYVISTTTEDIHHLHSISR